MSRPLVWANRLRDARANAAETTFVLLAASSAAALALFFGTRALAGHAAPIAEFLVAHGLVLALAWGLLVAALAQRRALALRLELERGCWSALPLSGAQVRAAHAVVTAARAAWCLLLWVVAALGSSYAAARPPSLAVLAYGTLAVAIGAAAGAAFALRRRDVEPREPQRALRAPWLGRIWAHWDRGPLPHLAHWQRMASRAVWLGRRTVLAVGIVGLLVPGNSGAYYGALMLVLGAVLVGSNALLGGALEVIARASVVTAATAVDPRALRRSAFRYPIAVLGASAALATACLHGLGAPVAVALSCAAILLLIGATRLCAMLAHRHRPRHARWHAALVLASAAALASVFAPLALVWLSIDNVRCWILAGRIR